LSKFVFRISGYIPPNRADNVSELLDLDLRTALTHLNKVYEQLYYTYKTFTDIKPVALLSEYEIH